MNTSDCINKIIAKKCVNDTFSPDELYNLVLRVTGSRAYAESFEFRRKDADCTDCYSIFSENGKNVIEATNSISGAVAFNYYLTHTCKCYFGPVTKRMELPDAVPLIKEAHSDKSRFIYRYFMNYCTYSYTLLYADWDEYERLTDWMLLSGINLLLSIVGHEIVIRDTLTDIGYTEEEACNYLTGPAYLPWFYMGNMTGFGGNLPKWWFDKQKKLGNRINDKMRAFGANVIMPGFYGLVPDDFKSKFPDSDPVYQGMWCDAFVRPAIITDKDPQFERVTEAFYRKTREHFGEINYFSGDPFHEGGDSSDINVADFGKALVDGMQKEFPGSTWLFQGWGNNPSEEILSQIPKEDVLIVYLGANSNKDNYSTYKYNGYPWIYSATNNFGATRSLKGNIKGFLTEPIGLADVSEQCLVGTGMTMEGIEMDEVVYDAFASVAIRDKVQSAEDFVEAELISRFGYANDNLKQAYKYLLDKIYVKSAEDGYASNESILCARPDIGVEITSFWAMVKDGFDLGDMIKMCSYLLEEYDALKDNDVYRLELSDYARQALAEKGREYSVKFSDAYKAGDKEEFKLYSDKFLALFDLVDEVMSVNSGTRLTAYMNRAADYAEGDKEMILFNARNLIHLWASKDGADELRDYAHREWNGMMGYYKRRWQIFFDYMMLNFGTGKASDICWKELDYARVFEEVTDGTPCIDMKDTVKRIIDKCRE